jgi:hypothetical protein
MAKRATVNADLFASTQPHKRKSATFYFDESTLARLHDAWLAELAKEPRATKSAIVEAALRKHLGLEQGGH